MNADQSWAHATQLINKLSVKNHTSPRSVVKNEYNVYCKAHELVAPLRLLVEEFKKITEVMVISQEAVVDMNLTLEQIVKIQKHIHDCHWHPYTHYAEEGVETVPVGDIYRPHKPDEISLLMAESQSGRDKDSNGMVYCYDFIISNSDASKPGVLRDVEMHFEYDGIELPTKSMTWASYLATIPWCTE